MDAVAGQPRQRRDRVPTHGLRAESDQRSPWPASPCAVRCRGNSGGLRRRVRDGAFADGDPVTDKAGAQVNIDYEWDLFAAADPDGTRDALDEIAKNAPSDDQEKDPPAVTARNQLRDAAKSALTAVETLIVLSASHGSDVFGDPLKVEEIKKNLQKTRDKLNQHAPEPSSDPYEDEYGDEDSDD